MKGFVLTSFLLSISTLAFAFNNDAPVDVVSDTLELAQNKKTAVFSGNVKVKHGRLALGADNLKITYKDAEGVENIVASGHVTVVDGENTATSEIAHYNPDNGMVTMSGNVKMLRNGNVLTGEELLYNPEEGTMKLANEAESGRVRASFSLDTMNKAEE